MLMEELMARPGLMPNGNPRPDYEAHLEPAVVEQLPALIGRDPRSMTPEQLESIGHSKQPLLRVIRTNCIECAGGSEAELRRCRMHWCPFWPYRMGSNPFTARTGNPEALANAHARRQEARQGRAEIEEAGSGGVE
jgi:hypothetical protein